MREIPAGALNVWEANWCGDDAIVAVVSTGAPKVTGIAPTLRESTAEWRCQLVAKRHSLGARIDQLLVDARAGPSRFPPLSPNAFQTNVNASLLPDHLTGPRAHGW